MTKPPTADHQTAPKPEQWSKPGMAMISYADPNRVVCSCGWGFSHMRSKIVENSIDRHLARRHGGVGLRF